MKEVRSQFKRTLFFYVSMGVLALGVSSLLSAEELEKRGFQPALPREKGSLKKSRSQRKQKPSKLHSKTVENNLFFGLGALTYNTGRVSDSPTGAESALGSFYGQLGVMGRFSAFSDFFVFPTLSFTPVGKNTQDSAATSRVFLLSAPIGRVLGPIEWKAGFGLLFYSLAGNEGTVQANNGNGTDTFFTPAGSSLSLLGVFDVGLGVPILPELRFDFDAAITGLLSSRRAFHFSTLLSYGVRVR